MVRCVNIDWLECYCLEDTLTYPHDAEYFRVRGWHVVEREYGTPVYHEMFTLYGRDDEPLLEVRRRPKSARGYQDRGVLDPNACHIRLCDRTCYFENAATLMQQFLEQYGFHFQRISRLDIAYDFERFDWGDDPQDFLQRYMSHKYSKINQANIASRGRDRWDSRLWNSVSWGQQKSMVGTKFYLKTLELLEVRDKPYIRQAWRAAGLVTDDLTLEKVNPDGTSYKPDIWRVEFSIKSSTRKWFVIEDNNGAKTKVRSIQHTLSMYQTRQQLWNMFLSLADHYFHFKHFKEGVRKDRCKDKLLFRTTDQATFYKLENVASATPTSKAYNALLAKLYSYRDTHVMPEIFKACNVLIEALEKELRLAEMTRPYPSSELTLMRLLIARRIKDNSRPFSSDLAEVRALLQIDNDLFGEVDQKQ